MATDYGIDVDCTTDLDRYFGLVTGPTAVGQAVARILQTPIDGLIDAPGIGYDVRQWLNVPMTEAQRFEAESQSEDACIEGDERVQLVTAILTQEAGDLTIDLTVELVEGETFSLTLEVSNATVDVIWGSA